MAIDDELINRVTWKIPNALALVGSRAGDERNGMTTSWITQLAMSPVLIGIGVDNKAVTRRLIAEGGSFTVNLWDAEDTRPFVKFSKPAAYDADAGTLNGRPVRDGATGAPVFDDVRQRAIGEGDHRRAAGERLHGNQRARLRRQARHDQAARPVEQLALALEA